MMKLALGLLAGWLIFGLSYLMYRDTQLRRPFIWLSIFVVVLCGFGLSVCAVML